MKAFLGPPLRDAEANELVAIDIELFGADEKRLHRPDEGEFASMAIAMRDEVYLVEDQKEVDEALRRVRRGIWSLHHSVFDLRHLRRWSNIRPDRVWDTMLVERDLFGGWYDRFSLADLVRRWLSIHMDKEARELFSDGESLDRTMREYNMKDAILTRMVAEAQAEYAPSDFRWYWEIDEPMIWAVLDMPGVRIDTKKWEELAEQNEERYKQIVEELGFNPRSHQQVKEYVNDEFGVKLKNTAEATLLQASKKNKRIREVIGKIIDARGAGKNASTYGMSWLKWLEGEYVYPDWRVVGAETGRTSSADPTMQNIPVRKTPEYREAIIASPGNKLMVSDVSQQEIRISAYYSQDEKLLEILRQGGDTHLSTAKLIFENPDLTKESDERRSGKAINLGISYGLTASGLARRIGVPVARASSMLEKYFTTFPGMSRLHNRLVADAASRLHVKTASGRPVWINPYFRQWENNAKNAPIQGTGGDHMKLAAVLMHRGASGRGLPFCLNLLVHDELVVDAPKNTINEYEELARESWMEAADYLMPGLPMEIDSAIGDNWRCKT